MKIKKRNLYELLEIDPGAREDEIRRAYKRLNRLFDPSGVVVYGLYSRAEAEELLEGLKQAYDTLMEPEKRRVYDQSLFPHGHPSLRRADERVATKLPEPRPAPPVDPLAALELPEDVSLRGPILGKVREICHIPLEEIAECTKISMFTLRCIESEQFADLPAPVYLRGFLKQIASMLGLKVERVLHDYMESYQEWEQFQDPRGW